MRPIIVLLSNETETAIMKADQFLVLLKVPATLAGKPVSDERRIQAMNARLFGLGFGVECSRCNGTGHYSYNLISGTRCFKCQGSKFEAPKLTQDLYARVSAAVESGALDAYLSSVRARLAVERAAKGATDTVMTAWSALKMDSVYSWIKASQGVQPDKDISNEVNAPMSAAYKRVSELATKADSIAYKLNGGARNSKALSNEERAALETDRAQVLADLITAREEALETIASKAALIPEIKARHKV